MTRDDSSPSRMVVLPTQLGFHPQILKNYNLIHVWINYCFHSYENKDHTSVHNEKILRTDTQFLKIATNQLHEEKPVAFILRNYMKLTFSSLAWSFSEEIIGLCLFPSTTGAASSRGSPRGFAPQNRGLPVHEFLAFQIAPSDKHS